MQSVMLEIAKVYELFTIIDEESPRINARAHAHTHPHIRALSSSQSYIFWSEAKAG